MPTKRELFLIYILNYIKKINQIIYDSLFPSFSVRKYYNNKELEKIANILALTVIHIQQHILFSGR